MSAEAVHTHHEEFLAHQFEDRKQQDDAYLVGMWTFLVTEVMFFGGLFLAYLIYRVGHPEVFSEASEHLSIGLGGFNTMVLLSSSLFMALGVRAGQLKQRGVQIFWLVMVMACAATFMVVKGFEYTHKYHEHLVPGAGFQYHSAAGHAETQAIGEPMASTRVGASDPPQAQMFFTLYFAMTGLHGIHVIVGFIIIGVVVVLLLRKSASVRYYIPVEMVGLYWHFVDIVWIFLFPLFYLIPN